MKSLFLKNTTDHQFLLKLYNEGNYKEAYKLALYLTKRNSKIILVWKILGALLQDKGDLEGALKANEKALKINPNDPEVFNNLGVIQKALSNFKEAELNYKKALLLSPYFFEANFNLGNLYKKINKIDKAEKYFKLALHLRPDISEIHSNLGIVYADTGRIVEAEECYKRAIQISFNNSEASCNLAILLYRNERFIEAELYIQKSLSYNPTVSIAHSNYGLILQAMGRHNEAVESHQRAISLSPENSTYYSNLLFCLSHMEEVDPQELFKLHCDFGERFEAPLRSSWPIHTNDRDPNRCLKVGFVSGDFRNHAVANFIEPILSGLSQTSQFSLFGYDNFPIHDSVTERLKDYFAHWSSICNLTDEALAKKIRDDQIDILIDLSGHTAYNRLLTFARKPAPIQVSWIGYPGTTGLQAIDYLLADEHYLPIENFQHLFTEEIIYLPAAGIFSPSKNSPNINELPALINGYVTFGSFNRTNKITRSVIALWSELLHAVPNSRMILGGMPPETERNVWLEWFIEEKINPDRLKFYSKKPIAQYLELHNLVDICLDTYPYNGGTTTWHAIWMGVPTLTLTGNTVVSRCGVSILKGLGLESFVALNKKEFIEKGVDWCSRTLELAKIRSEMRTYYAKSAAGQNQTIVNAMSEKLRDIWKNWCLR